MATSAEALMATRETLEVERADGDIFFTAWQDLAAYEALEVHDLFGGPAYWLVPLLSRDNPVGFARVSLDGIVQAIGFTCRTPEMPERCPTPSFAMSKVEVEKMFLRETRLAPGETYSTPRYVHDGSPGREAWLIETSRNDRPTRWVFVGPGGVYERPAGHLLEEIQGSHRD